MARVEVCSQLMLRAFIEANARCVCNDTFAPRCLVYINVSVDVPKCPCCTAGARACSCECLLELQSVQLCFAVNRGVQRVDREGP
jgi:hypothetical protein